MRFIGAKISHESVHVRRATNPLKRHRRLAVSLEAHTPARVLKCVNEIQASGKIVSGYLAHKRQRLHAILVAHVGALEITAALRQPEEEAFNLPRRLKETNLLPLRI